MMRWRVAIVAGSVLAGLVCVGGAWVERGDGTGSVDMVAVTPLPALEAGRPEDDDSWLDLPRAWPHPHGRQLCASGCALSNHPTPSLAGDEFHHWLSQYATQAVGQPTEALESLLFHGPQTRRLLDRLEEAPLDPVHVDFLRRELARTHALVALRIRESDGTVRADLPPTRVPLDLRHVYDLSEGELGPLEASGTVKRVGLHHLWTRI